jgi:uncharacterized protein (DUF1015 family)
MAEIQAFRGIRYNLGHVGSLSDVIAPPYDVITPDLQDLLYRKHPCNVVRLELNRQEPGDDEANNAYIRASRFFRTWMEQGVLFTETVPAIYVYHLEFPLEGRQYLRRGFMARMRLERFGEGKVFPHEETYRAPKIDRLMLTAVCKANFSQIFVLYPDPQCEVDALLDQAISNLTPLQAVDHLGVIHRVWPVTDLGVITRLASLMGPKPVFIADGHHRYETACDYRDQVRDSGIFRPDHPSNYVLTYFVAMEDPGLVIFPTHRLLRNVGRWTAEMLRQRLQGPFRLRFAGHGLESAPEVWEDLATASAAASFGFYTPADQVWTIAEITEEGLRLMDQIAQDHHEPWRRVGVCIFHRLVLQHLLELIDFPKPHYVHLISEVMEACKRELFDLVALVPPVSVRQLREVSLMGERFPQKSTYFFPKPAAGLVINPLE